MRGMKKQNPGKILVTILTLTLLFTCGAPTALAAKKPKLTKSSVTLIVGQSTKVKVKNKSGKVTWKSGNSKVATVKNGKITAKKKGNTAITAKVSKKKLTCKVKVESPSLSKTRSVLLVGKKLTLKLNGTSQKVTWKSSSTGVATVSTKGVVTAKKKGTASVTATVLGKKYTCKVTVENPALNVKKATLLVGKKLTLKLNGTSQKVTWKSSNTGVATVTAKGVVTAKNAGSADVSATVQGKKFTCKVTVENPFLNTQKAVLLVGRQLNLKLNGTGQKVTWTSSNTKIVTVTSKGVITAKNTGTATVTATVLGRSFPCTVTVKTSNGNPVPTSSGYEDAMIDLLVDLSNHAKNINPSFAMISNGGYELYLPNALVSMDSTNRLLSCLDGVLVESAFYGWDNDLNATTPANATRDMLDAFAYAQSQKLATFNMEYCSKANLQESAGEKSQAAGTVWYCAPSLDLNKLPALAAERTNKNNCTSLSKVRNFVALLDSEAYSSRESYLNALKNTDYDLIFIDLYYNEVPLTKQEVNALKKKKNGGTRMVCAYMSVGEAEDYRDYWQSRWNNDPPEWVCDENEDWDGNYKVSYWEQEWRNILFGFSDSYLDQILSAGFDGVYLDVVDAYEYFTSNR